MPKLIVLRLVPDKPLAGDDFTPFLGTGGNVLIIDALDVSFGNQKGQRIGRAIHRPDVNSVISLGFPFPDPVVLIPDPQTDIVQHRRPNPITPPGNFIWNMKAIATAVIVINSPPPLEYAEPDVILEVKWGTVADPDNARLISRFSIGYNVAVRDVATWPPNDPNPRDPTLLVNAFQNIPAESVAAYVTLSDPSQLTFDPNDAFVTLPKDGSPPNFEDLRTAVNLVISKDPAGVIDPPNLTPTQARHIAYEIAWNRHIEPLPRPPSTDALEAMYTSPSTDDDAARAKFEASLTTYSSTHDAKGETLAKYVFSLSAAFAAAQASAAATRAKLTFPVQTQPGAVVPPGAIAEVSVALKNSTSSLTLEPSSHRRRRSDGERTKTTTHSRRHSRHGS